MSGLLLSAAFEDHAIRVVGTPEAPCWVAQDVCDALGIKSARSTMRGFDDDEKGVHAMHTPGGVQNLVTVTEAGLYRLIFRSNKDEAKRFARWVFHEVLPQIRKTGAYVEPSSQLVAADPERDPDLALGKLDVIERAGEIAARLGGAPVELARFRELALLVAVRTTGEALEPCDRLPQQWLTVAEVAHSLGYRPTTSQLRRIGTLAASLYRERRRSAPKQELRVYGDREHWVAVYAPHDHDLAERAVRELLDPDADEGSDLLMGGDA